MSRAAFSIIKNHWLLICLVFSGTANFDSVCLAAPGDSFTPNEITAYRPAPKGTDNSNHGLSDTTEGGQMDAHGGVIWGQHTFEDYHNGKGGNDPYVAIAMDKNSPYQGSYLTSPQYPGTVFKVVDNGGYGNGKTGNSWMDIAWSDPNMANGQNPNGTNKNGANGWATFTEVSKEEAAQIAANRDPNGYSGDSGDYVLGGQKGIKPGDSNSPEVYGPGKGSAAQGSKRNPLAGIMSGNDPNRIYKKGVSSQQVYQTMDTFSQSNEQNMSMLGCNQDASTLGHNKDALEDSWPWSYDVEDGECHWHINYPGDGPKVGLLKKKLGCCVETWSGCVMWWYLVTDEIEYRFPVETRDSSIQIGDSPLRINYQNANGNFDGNSSTGKPDLPPARSTPGAGTGTPVPHDGNEPIKGPFYQAFEECAPGCSPGNPEIWGDERHQRRRSCHNSGSAIDFYSVNCGGSSSGPGTAKFNEVIACLKTKSNLYVIHGTKDHYGHAHVALYDCEHNGNGKIQTKFD